MWRGYFKFAFDRNPWDRQVSFYHHRYRGETAPPPFAAFMHHDRHARVNNYDIYSIDGDVAVDFVGRFENLEEDLKVALSHVGLDLTCELPRAKSTFRRGQSPIATTTTRTRAPWLGTGIGARSSFSTMHSERLVLAA